MGNRHSIRLGLIQAVPVKWDQAANWAIFERLATQASQGGAQLICTPECFLDGYVADDNEGWSAERFRQMGQARDTGSYLDRALRFAADHRVHLVFGFTELGEGGCFNAAALIGDRGQIIGVYHKTHLLDHDTRYLPGDALPVFDTALGRVGIMICADRRWPETARTLRVRGAEMIINPSYGMWHLDNEWWMRTRSYENEMFIAFVHPRVALILNPEGEVAAKLQSNLPAVLLHDVDLSEVRDRMFRHRRTDIYQ